MIKTGIIGGHTLAAGELIRILVNHPDVTIMWVSSPQDTLTALYSSCSRLLQCNFCDRRICQF